MLARVIADLLKRLRKAAGGGKPEAERLAAFVRADPAQFRHLADPGHALVSGDILGTPREPSSEAE